MLFWGKRKKAARPKSSTLSLENLERREMMAVMAIASGETLSFRDGDGSSVRVMLTGPGQGTLDLTNGVIENLTLTGTTGESELKISTSGGSIPGTTIRDLAIDNAIGEIAALARLYAPKIDVATGGEWSADADIGELRVRDLLANSEIEVAGNVGKIKARTLSDDASSNVTGRIGEIVVDMLLDGSQITAERIEYLQLKKSADGALIEAGTQGIQLAKLKNFSNSTIASAGDIGELRFDGSTLGSAIASNIDAGSDGNFGTFDDFVIDPSIAGNINKLDIRGEMGSTGSPDEMNVVASGQINELKLGQRIQRAGQAPSVWEQAASQFIPLDISQLYPATTGFTDDQIWIAIYGTVSDISSTTAGEQYYIDASDHDGNNNPIYVAVSGVTPSSSTPDLPILPSSTIQDWNNGSADLAFKVPQAGQKWSGRILISAGTPVQVQVAQAQPTTNNSVSSPSPANPGDPSTGTFYDFLEFTVVNNTAVAGGTISIDVDTSQVDEFGMPMSLQFLTDAPTPASFDVTVTGNTTGTRTITGVTGLTGVVGKGQPILGPGIQPGTMITNVVGNTITLNMPTTTSQTGGSFTVKPAGPVGVEQDRNLIFSGGTKDELYKFLHDALKSGSSQARPFLQSAAPYAVSGNTTIDGMQIQPGTITTGNQVGNLQAGGTITISGVSSMPGLNNRTFVAAVVAAGSPNSTITLGGPVGNGNYIAGSGTLTTSSGQQVGITAASYAATSAIVLTTLTAPSVNVNDVVTVANVTGNTAANGTFLVDAVNGNLITLGSPVGASTYTSGGTWAPAYTTVTNVDAATLSTPIRIYTDNVSGLLNGDNVFIGNVGGITAANGAFVVQNVNQTQNQQSGYFDLANTAGTGGGTYTPGTGSWAPYYSITGATDGGEVLVTTDSTAGMSNNDIVSISGVLGTTVANGAHAVTVNSPTSFTLNDVVGNAAYTSGGSWAFAITDAYTRDTILETPTASLGALSVGDVVTVTGATGNTSINGQFEVTGVQPNGSNPAYITLGGPIGNSAYTGGGYWTLPQASTTPVLGVATQGTTVTISTGNTVGLSAGDTVLLSGVDINSVAGGVFTVANVTDTSFMLNGSNSGGPYTSGGTWQVVHAITGATDDGNPIVITTSDTTGLVAYSSVIQIAGINGNTAANGAFVISGVSSNTITLGSPASSTTYNANSASWTGNHGGSGTVSWANSGGGVQVVTSSTHGLTDHDLVSIGGILGNTAANGFFEITNVSSMGFTLVGSLGNGTFQYNPAAPGQFAEHAQFNRLVSPKDVVEALATAADPNQLNNYYNEVIDQFFLQYLPSSQSVSNQSGGGQTLVLASNGVTYNGTVTNAGTENGGYVMRFIPAGTNPPAQTAYNPNTLDIYYPYFNTNLPSANVYTPLFATSATPPPSWLGAQAHESASRMLFACDAIFADNDPRQTAGMLPAQATILADLENSISAAFNRGIALNPAQSWGDTTQWFPETGTYNYWVQYWHQNGLTYDDRAYGFPYDDKFGASTNLDFSGVGQVNITLGPWSATQTPTPTVMEFDVTYPVPTSAPAGSQVTLGVKFPNGAPGGGTVAFFIDGRAINSDNHGATPPIDLVPVTGSTATITATLPSLPATGHTYTLTAVYSGFGSVLPSVLYYPLLVT